MTKRPSTSPSPAPRRHRQRRKRAAISLALLLAIIVLVAQLAGASLRRPAHRAPAGQQLAVIADAPVVDVSSTRVGAARTISARSGDTVRMSGTASLTLGTSRRDGAEVVCGLRYARKGDPSWTLGDPYDARRLTPRHRTARISMTRTFAAPATDTYSVSYACHVSSPRSGANVRAVGGPTLRVIS